MAKISHRRFTLKEIIVDEETQRNDLAIIKRVAQIDHVVPPQRAYDFSFARQAEQQLINQGRLETAA